MAHLSLLFLGATLTFAQPEVPELKNWASDFTNTLSKEELQQLNSRLKTFEDTTSNQLVSLMISSLDGYPLEDYSYEVAEKNKIGTKEHSNGILLLVIKNDRKMRIEVGYGLEGAVPDALANSIIRNEITPHFRNEDYYAGLISGINSIISAIGGEYKSDYKEDDNYNGVPGFIVFLIIFFMFVIVLPRIRRFNKSGGYRYSGGGWTSGRFGGGSGGFSGGGGSFGGGGSSGSW